MIPFDTTIIFFSASVALALAPGPDNIFVLTQAALHGRLAGFMVTLGLCTGLIFHTAAVAVGVAAIFAASEAAFNGLKVIGGGYLLYLAWQAWRAGSDDLNDGQKAARNWSVAQLYARVYGRGVIMNITNPKVAIFFLAFLPQFAEPANGSVAIQIILLGLLFMLSTLLIFGSVAYFAGFIGERLRRSAKAQVVMNKIAAVVFIGLAVRLVGVER